MSRRTSISNRNMPRLQNCQPSRRASAEELTQTLKACEGKLSTSIEDRQKLSHANTQMSKELAGVRKLEQEGLAKVVEATRDATKRVKQLNLTTESPVWQDPCRSLPAVVEFIMKVVVDIRVFKNNIFTLLANDKNSTSKQTAAMVMAAFKEANPNAIIPGFLVASPSNSSLWTVSAFASVLAKKTFPPR